MAEPALKIAEHPHDDAGPLPLGDQPDLYADLLPMDIALSHAAVVIDVFEGHAMVATSRNLSETVRDALFQAGYPAMEVPCDDHALRDLQERVYLRAALHRAEAEGASGIGVIRWLRKPAALRFAVLSLPLLVSFPICVLYPDAMLWMGAGLIILIVLFRSWTTTHHLPETFARTGPSEVATPKITLLVPLYKEDAILPRLIERLARLRYPVAQLEIVFLLEHADIQSRAALARIPTPAHMRSFTVPKGSVQTKPRAMNAALPFTSGQIIGVYDAEDAPDPDQLTHVATAFATDTGLACLQAPLDIYNAHKAPLAGCFAVEYAMLFRVQNPTLAARSLPLPLGGTSFFVRREAILALGAWDAFNVTEDADLGLRLHARGYTTAMISTPTFEEAPTSVAAWTRQRSRWLKGFMLTWLTLGPGLPRTYTVLLLLGPIIAASICLLSLPLWSVGVGAFGMLRTPAFQAFSLAAIASEASLFFIGWRALKAPHLRRLRPYLLLMPLYRLFLIPALIKAVTEAVSAPAFWDKTEHGTAG